MPPKSPFLSFSELQWRQRQRIVQTVYEQIAAHCPAVQDVTNLSDAVFAKWAFLPNMFAEKRALCSVVGFLGSEVVRSQQISAAISVTQLDQVVCRLPFQHLQLI